MSKIWVDFNQKLCRRQSFDGQLSRVLMSKKNSAGADWNCSIDFDQTSNSWKNSTQKVRCLIDNWNFPFYTSFVQFTADTFFFLQ